MVRVAVVTPTYQHGAFIDACIQSVLAQSFEDWEMIVVDDGSNDGTPERVEACGDQRIRLIRQAHRGLGFLANTYATALRTSEAEFVAILEGDDAWPKSKLATQLPLLDDPSVVLSYGAAGLIDERGCEYASYWRRPEGSIAANDPVGSILPALALGNFIVSPTVIVRRSALNQVGGFAQPTGVPYVDHPTWLELALRGRFAPCPEVVGYWRRHAAQYTTSGLAVAGPDMGPFLQAIAAEAEGRVAAETLDRYRVAIADGRLKDREWAAVGRGRLALLDGEWAIAISIWRKLLRAGRPATVLVALLGMAAAVVHSDLEWLYRRTGRVSWPSRRHMRAHARQDVAIAASRR